MPRRSKKRIDLTGTGYCASINFRRTSRAVTRLYDAAMHKSGIRSTQFAILVGVAKTQPVSIGRLGEILVIDDTTLTRSLNLLKRDGLIASSDRSTMRQKFLTVTPKGERALARALPYWRKIHDKFEAAVGRPVWLKLRAELERLAKLAVDLESAGIAR